MSNDQLYARIDPDYTDEAQTSDERPKMTKQRRPSMIRTRGKSPQSVNGMHRRRRRKFTW